MLQLPKAAEDKALLREAVRVFMAAYEAKPKGKRKADA
jgi:hypothetical protein